jgi:camelysin-like metallo-endopeptidase
MMDDLLQEMIDPAPVHHDAPRRRRLWTTVAIVGLAAVGATTLTTSAIFTDNDATSAVIESGTVDLAIGKDVDFAFSPQNLAPGDSTFVPLQINNRGSLALRYAIYYSAEQAADPGTDPVLDPPATAGDLRDVLVLNVYPIADQNGCSALALGTTAPLNTAPATSWPSASTSLVGSTAQGDDDGDRELTVEDSSEWLCFRVDFPVTPESQNQFQNAGVTLAVSFHAEQVANNP